LFQELFRTASISATNNLNQSSGLSSGISYVMSIEDFPAPQAEAAALFFVTDLQVTDYIKDLLFAVGVVLYPQITLPHALNCPLLYASLLALAAHARPETRWDHTSTIS